ncbi:MAG: hypothetical protein K0R87_3481 [Pseudonocardia sp.]|nr:hypothetical protein [Pseudonocardia sp.]
MLFRSLGIEAGPQRGEVGMGGAYAVQQQEGFARSGAIPGESKRHRDHGIRAEVAGPISRRVSQCAFSRQ